MKAAALELLEGGGGAEEEGGEAPAKGLFALPFMKRALERKKVQAQEEARQVTTNGCSVLLLCCML